MGMIEIGPRDEMKKLYNTPANKRLKRCAWVAILVMIALMLVTIIWIDDLSVRAILWLRGFAGLAALVFVVLYVCLVYRVNRDYINRK